MADDFTYKYNERQTTQWEEILIEKGIIHEESGRAERRAAREEAKNRDFVKEDTKLEKMVKDDEQGIKKLSLKELDNLDSSIADEDDEEESKLLAKLREKRINELKNKKSRERFGDVYTIGKDDFITEVTEASAKSLSDGASSDSQSKGTFVIVELFQDGLKRSNIMSEAVRYLAKACPSRKFCRIVANKCVENWPDSKVPCLFIYHGGKMQFHIEGLSPYGGEARTNPITLAQELERKKVLSIKDDVHLDLLKDFIKKSKEQDKDDNDDDW